MKKIAYVSLTAVLMVTAFFIGKNTYTQLAKTEINLSSVKGWETFEDSGKVGLEIQTTSGTWTLEKEPFTAHGVIVEKVD